MMLRQIQHFQIVVQENSFTEAGEHFYKMDNKNVNVRLYATYK